MARPSAERHGQCPEGSPWEWLTTLLRAQLNCGWWLSTWLPGVLAVGIVGTFALLWARWQRAAVVPLVWWGIGAGLGLAAVVAWLQARQRFESRASARILLEDALGLHTRLTSAAAGVGPWPEPVSGDDRRWPVTWRWQRPVGMFALVAVMLTAAALVPVASARAVTRQVIEKPTDAAVVERWNDALRREEAIDERSAEAIEQQIAELLERPRDQWYEHASLEAASALREQTAADLEALAKNLATAADAAAKLASISQQATAEQRAAAAATLAAASERLASGDIHPGAKASAAGKAAGLSREELRQLAATLRDNGQRLKNALAQAGDIELTFEEAPPCDGCEPCVACAECRGGRPCAHACEACRSGKGAGKGSVNRGPGAYENRFADRERRATARPEQIGLPADDARAAPGELLGVIDGGEAPEPEAYAGPQAGGAVEHRGSGGTAARIDNLVPAEQETVRRFFRP